MMSESKTDFQTPHVNGAHHSTYVNHDSAYRASSEAAELLRSDAGDISATTVTLDRSGAETITAERVQLDRSGARTMTTKSAQLDQSGVMSLNSDHTVLQGSSAVYVQATDARIVKSKILFFRSERSTVEGSLKPLIHIGHACDNVKPVFDSSGALRFGAALGAVLLIGGRLLKSITGGR